MLLHENLLQNIFFKKYVWFPRRLNNFALTVMSISIGRGGITRNRKTGSIPILHRALEGYLGNLEKRPMLTKGISSGIIAGIGNFIQQSLSDVAFVSSIR